jgi:hypothetical protein
MSRFQISAGMVLSGAILLAAVSSASTLEEATIFTFKAPVEVPGRVLPAGTYLFKLDQRDGELNVVEIKNQNENKVYGVFLVKPEYQMRVPGRSGIIFEGRAGGAPQAVKAWLYPGDKYEYEFIYRK